MTPTKGDATGPMPVAHVHAQYCEHDEAFLVANVPALVAIRDAITKAIEGGHAAAQLFVADGEGYALFVIREDSDWQGPVWRQAMVPYGCRDVGASPPGRGDHPGTHPGTLALHEAHGVTKMGVPRG